MNYAQNALVGYAEKGLMEAAVQRLANRRRRLYRLRPC